MSTGFGMVPTWLRGKVTRNELCVYVALTWRLDADGTAFPSHALLAEDSGVSVSSVQRALNRLRELGVVDWEQRARPNDPGQTSNRYTVHVHRQQPLPARSAGSQAPLPDKSAGSPQRDSPSVTVTDPPLPPGQGDRPPRSQGPAPSVTLTDELDPGNKTHRTNGVEENSDLTGGARPVDNPKDSTGVSQRLAPLAPETAAERRRRESDEAIQAERRDKSRAAAAEVRAREAAAARAAIREARTAPPGSPEPPDSP